MDNQKIRKAVSWRVSDLPQKELINEWLNKQSNIQTSITNIVLHMINRFGMKDIMDYDIQKILYQEISHVPDVKQASDNSDNSDKKNRNTFNSKSMSSSSVSDTEDDDDDLYKDVDVNTIF
ncbi:hypothetical protein P9246_10865 [Aeribacillus pallidus]|uniref:hypothetical protein n=1 Tax=Aeribacillus composti TaxID=1868734 RepID=UPI002E1E8D78|nr:hypothetical protein [Aeribacillus composti]MED4487242.1 hypothetical protein [Aeribacillus pallidus]